MDKRCGYRTIRTYKILPSNLANELPENEFRLYEKLASFCTHIKVFQLDSRRITQRKHKPLIYILTRKSGASIIKIIFISYLQLC